MIRSALDLGDLTIGDEAINDIGVDDDGTADPRIKELKFGGSRRTAGDAATLTCENWMKFS